MTFVLLGLVIGGALAYLTLDVPSVQTRQSAVVPPLDVGGPANDGTISVDVVGEGVVNPGEYELSADSEVIDLIRRAGGLKTGAITEGINWRASLYEGLRLTIPTHEVLRKVKEGERTLRGEDLIRFRHIEPDSGDTEYVNINEAPASELDSLPGIGPVLSRRIVRYRDENGPFERKDDLEKVTGIGEITLQELRSKIELR